MTASYQKIEQVRKDMQLLLNRAAATASSIDEVALILHGQILERSQVTHFTRSKFETTDLCSLFEAVEGVLKGSFNSSSSLKRISFLMNEQDNLDAWTIAAIVVNNVIYHLVFTGSLENENMLYLHISASRSYVEALLPLITAFDLFV